MDSVFSQIGPWIFLLTLGSGMGVPLGIPPAPDDPVMAQFAPQECIFFTSWAASAAASPASKNQAEQLLAEPEVRQFADQIEKWLRHSVNQPGGRDTSGLSNATFDALFMVLRHQTTMFVSELKIKDKKVAAKGGMVVALGGDGPIATRLFHQHVREFFLNLNVESLEVVHIDGQRWYRVKPKAGFPTMTVGIKDSYLVVAVGEGVLDLIFDRMRKPAPEWLMKARRLAAVERPTGLACINLQRLYEVGPASSDPHRKQWMELLGLAQTKWLVSATGLVGPDVVTRTVLTLEGQPHGLLLPVRGRGLTKEDLAAIPADATLAVAARLNIQETLDGLAADASSADPEVKQALLKRIDALRHGGKGKSGQQVFASFGDHWCFYNSPREGGLVMTGLTGVVPITDRQQFSRNYETMMRLITQGLPPDDGPVSGGQRIRRFRFAGGDVHYASLGEVGLAPAWWVGEKQLVVGLAPQNVKAYLSRTPGSRSLAAVPEVAAEFSGRDPLLAIGYLDAPRLFESVYPLLLITGPAYLAANGLGEGRRDVSTVPSLPSICRHLRPGLATLRRTSLGLELESRGSLPGFGLAGPVMVMVWDSEWLNLVFGESENNAPPAPMAPAGGPGAPPAVPVAPVLPPAQAPPAPAR
jgi:hypothetical protein